MTTVFNDYIRSRYGERLSEVQYDSFNFILNAFPETVLVLDEGQYNTDMFDMLALLAMMLGKYRELIGGMKYSHSLEELRKLIFELEKLPDGDKNKSILENYYNLLAKAIIDLDTEDPDNVGEGMIDFDGNVTEEAKAYLMEKFYFFANEIARQRYIGSKLGIAQAVRDYISYDSNVADKAIMVDVEIINDKDDDPQYEGIVVKLKNIDGSDYSDQFSSIIDYAEEEYSDPGFSNLYPISEQSSMYALVKKYIPMATKLYIIAKALFYIMIMQQQGLDEYDQSYVQQSVDYTYRLSLSAVRRPDKTSVLVTLTNNNVVPMMTSVSDNFMYDGDDIVLISAPSWNEANRFILTEEQLQAITGTSSTESALVYDLSQYVDANGVYLVDYTNGKTMAEVIYSGGTINFKENLADTVYVQLGWNTTYGYFLNYIGTPAITTVNVAILEPFTGSPMNNQSVNILANSSYSFIRYNDTGEEATFNVSAYFDETPGDVRTASVSGVLPIPLG